MSKKLKVFLIILSVAMAITGAIIAVNLGRDNVLAANTTLAVEGKTTRSWKVAINDLYPGKSQSYTINFTGKAQTYLVSLSFRKGEDSSLNEFITVNIDSDGVAVEKRLSELIDGTAIECNQTTDKITITYTMPTAIGNEAQGTAAKFYIDLTVIGTGEQAATR